MIPLRYRVAAAFIVGAILTVAGFGQKFGWWHIPMPNEHATDGGGQQAGK